MTPGGRETLLVTEKTLEPDVPAGFEAECMEVTSLPEDGDYVIYIPSGGAALFRRFRRKPDGGVLLESLNRSGTSYSCRPEQLPGNGRLFVILSVRKEFRAGRNAEIPAPVPETGSADYLTFQEAMALLKVSRSRMYSLLQSGTLPAVKLGRLWRIERNSIHHFLALQTRK